MDNITLQLEQHYKAIGARPPRKFETTITRWDRDVFWYTHDTAKREVVQAKTTYEDHRKVIETAMTILGKKSMHDIAIAILTHRFFKSYRATVFGEDKNFNRDYSFIIKRIGALLNGSDTKLRTSNIAGRLADFKVPTLVQVNHLAGIVTESKIQPHNETLNELAQRLSADAPESTTYMVAGMSL